MARVIKAEQLREPPPPWRPQAVAPKDPPFPRGAPAPGAAGRSGIDLEAAVEAARRRGLAEGMRMAEESYRAKSARVESLSSALQRERQEFFARIEPELVRLAVTIAEKVIGRELELRPETVVDLVQAATKRLRERELLRVSVNPRDLERVREARDDLLSAVEGIQRLEIIEDRRVDPGGCVIESPNGTLDARIRTQLEEISRVLSELMPDPSLAEEDSPPEPHGTGPESLPASGQAD